MTVYTKTSAGVEAIKNPQINLPRRLRTLLICVDGKSSLQTYIRSLPSFGDVEALMDSLLEAGLIEVRASPGSQSSAFKSADLSNPPAPNYWGSGDSVSTNTPASLALRQAIDAMGDFVQKHLPDHSIEISIMLDKVESLPDLNQLMPGYLALIKPFGAKAEVHLRQLEPLLQAKLA